VDQATSSVKRFYGTSANAVQTQILIAVSVYVLVAVAKRRLRPEASLYKLLRILSLTLFEKSQILPALSPKTDRSEGAIRHNKLNMFTFWRAGMHYFIARRDRSGQACSDRRVYSNGAEEYFSRTRRGEIGRNHHVTGSYLIRYAQEASWRGEHRRVNNTHQLEGVLGLAMACLPSVDWCGYWQRAQPA
jgi:hypothetical protein